MAKKPSELDRVRERLRKAFAASGKTQEQVGVAMGYTSSGARQAVSRILNPEVAYDPRLSTVLAFARAVGTDLKDML